MAMVAQDTFSTVLKDGSELLVAKNTTWPDSHEVVKLDAGRGLLFKPLDESYSEKPKPEPEPSTHRGAGKKA